MVKGPVARDKHNFKTYKCNISTRYILNISTPHLVYTQHLHWYILNIPPGTHPLLTHGTHTQQFHLVQTQVHIQHLTLYTLNTSTLGTYSTSHLVHIQHSHMVPILNNSTWYKFNISFPPGTYIQHFHSMYTTKLLTRSCLSLSPTPFLL